MDVDGYALVVGAGSGIGLETALTYAERGAKGVAFADKNLVAATEASERSKDIATSEEYQTIALEVDVVDRKSVQAMVKLVQKTFGRLDYAVNSAGIPQGAFVGIGAVNEEEFDAVFNVNCKGIMHCLQEELEVMQAQDPMYVEGRSGRRSIGPGAIVNITSLSALVGHPGTVNYTTSKFAARGLIKCAALENRNLGLRINEVCPGYTDTPFLKNKRAGNAETLEAIRKVMPLGRFANVEEIAQTAHFLTSPAASFVNGQSIVIDSGVSAAVVG